MSMLKKPKSDRRWRVVYNLAYDGGGGYWNGYYRTKLGAQVARWWNTHIASWGGNTLLIDQNEYRAPVISYKDLM